MKYYDRISINSLKVLQNHFLFSFVNYALLCNIFYVYPRDHYDVYDWLIYVFQNKAVAARAVREHYTDVAN